MRPPQTKNYLHSKRNHQQNEKGTHCKGEHICQWYIWWRVNIQSVETFTTRYQEDEQYS